MSRLLGAIDDTNNLKYFAFVVGDQESISANLKQLPVGFMHMTFMRNKHEKKTLLDKFNFNGNIRVCCMNFGLDQIKETVDRALRSVNKVNMSTKKRNDKIAFEVVYTIKNLYANFAIQNGCQVNDIEFEVDNPKIKGYLKDGGLKSIDKGEILKLADCIVHANGHGMRVNNVIEGPIAFCETFHERVAKSLTGK